MTSSNRPTVNTLGEDLADIAQLDQISKSFGRFPALKDLTMTIPAGVTGLLGPNGAGKSTMIKILLGLLRATRGRASVLGFDVRKQSLQIRRQVGYMPEDDCYIGGISGVESVRFAARLSGRPSVESLRRAHEILDFCGAGQERYRTIETYSTGMRQKAKFAQAIVHDPDFIILDEPTSGLDPEERRRMLTRIRNLADSGKAVMISTHILPDVQEICDNVVILVGGKLQISESLEVLRRPSSYSYQARLLSGRDEFVEHVSREGVQVDQADDGTLTLHLTEHHGAESIWEWASTAGSTIRSLQPARNSLEAIFVNAVREAGNASP